MFQFVHVNSYSRTLSKKAKHAKWTAQDVINEATRDPDSIPHIESPKPHVHLYGDPIEKLTETLDTWANNTTDAKGRKTRKDAVCLLAGVFSVPADTPPDQWEKIKTDAIDWAKSKYGERLKTVIEHQDEAHPHCHFYVVPLPGETFETVHEGRAAVKKFVAEGGDKKKTNSVYRDVMRGFQNEYYDAVGAANGMTRIGPGKRRLSREAWRMEQQQAEAIAEQHKRAEALLEASKDKVESVKKSAEVFKSKVKAEADEIRSKALSEADQVIKKAEKTGFERGLDAFGQLPWMQKFNRLLSKTTRERDQLKAELEDINKVSDKLDIEFKTLKSKAKAWFESAKELIAIKPKLEKALQDVEHLKILNREIPGLKSDNANLNRKLDGALARAQHLESVVESLTPAEAEVEKTRKRRKEMDSGFNLG